MLLYERFLAARDVSDFHPIQMPELSEWEDIYGLHSTSVYPAAWLVIAGAQPQQANSPAPPNLPVFLKRSSSPIIFLLSVRWLSSAPGRLNYTAEIPVSIKAEITEQQNWHLLFKNYFLNLFNCFCVYASIVCAVNVVVAGVVAAVSVWFGFCFYFVWFCLFLL